VNLGHTPEQIHDILKYVLGSLSLHDSPHINVDSLKRVGFTDGEIEKIESSLPGMFELSFAFSAWSVPLDLFNRLGISQSEWQSPGFNLLRRLGFTRRQIDQTNDVICGRGCVEGAPHLRLEHYP